MVVQFKKFEEINASMHARFGFLCFTTILWLSSLRNLKKSVHQYMQGLASIFAVFGIWTKFHGQDGLWLIFGATFMDGYDP